MKYKHAVILDNYNLNWLYHDFWYGLPGLTSDSTQASYFDTSDKLPDDSLANYVDLAKVRKYHVVEVEVPKDPIKVKDKYKEQLDRIEKKVDALLNAELSKMPTPTPSPFIPNYSCPKCGISFKSPTNYVCTDLNCPTFFKTYSLALDPADRDWEYDGFGNRRRKGEID